MRGKKFFRVSTTLFITNTLGGVMLKSIRVLIISSVISSFMFADVFMTELTDPQNSSDAGRYEELHNNGDSDVDLATWSVQRWTNANADPTASSIVGLTGTISAGGFYIICNDAGKFSGYEYIRSTWLGSGTTIFL